MEFVEYKNFYYPLGSLIFKIEEDLQNSKEKLTATVIGTNETLDFGTLQQGGSFAASSIKNILKKVEI